MELINLNTDRNFTANVNKPIGRKSSVTDFIYL